MHSSHSHDILPLTLKRSEQLVYSLPSLIETLYADAILACRPPSPALTLKRSESSWLSCESSVDLEAQKQACQRQSYPSSVSSLQKCQPKKKRRFHFKPSPRMISDAIIGLSDGMTVPFALTAGLASLGDTRLVVLGGLAELIAGAISMGLGGLLGAKSEAYVPILCRA